MATLRSLTGLNDSQFARLLKEKKSKQTTLTKKVRNLLTIVDHFLISWEKEDGILLVKNLLDLDTSWIEHKQNSGKSSSNDHLLVSIFYRFYCVHETLHTSCWLCQGKF